MSLGSGYLWLLLKFNYLISTLISLLIKTDGLSVFSFKRKQLRSRYKLDETVYSSLDFSVLVSADTVKTSNESSNAKDLLEI